MRLGVYVQYHTAVSFLYYCLKLKCAASLEGRRINLCYTCSAYGCNKKFLRMTDGAIGCPRNFFTACSWDMHSEERRPWSNIFKTGRFRRSPNCAASPLLSKYYYFYHSSARRKEKLIRTFDLMDLEKWLSWWVEEVALIQVAEDGVLKAVDWIYRHAEESWVPCGMFLEKCIKSPSPEGWGVSLPPTTLPRHFSNAAELFDYWKSYCSWSTNQRARSHPLVHITTRTNT